MRKLRPWEVKWGHTTSTRQVACGPLPEPPSYLWWFSPELKLLFLFFFLSKIKEYGVHVLCFSLRCSSHLKGGGVPVCLFHCWYVSKLSSSPALLQGCLRPPRLPVLLRGALFQLFQKFSRLPTFNPSSLSLWVEFRPSQKIYSNLVSVTLFGNRILAGNQVKTRSCVWA